MAKKPSRAPLEAAEAAAQQLGKRLAGEMPGGYVFFLLLASTGGDGVMTHVASMRRETTVHVLQEWMEAQRTQGFENVDVAEQCWCCGSKEAGFQFQGELRTARLCAECASNTRPVGASKL